MESSERELIQAAMRGDLESFEMIIPLYSRKLFAVAYAILQDREEAEDVVQETFLKACKNRWRLRDPEKFPAWLVSVARNRSRDLLRKRRTTPLPEEAMEIADDTVVQPDAQSVISEMRQSVIGAIALLPETHRIAVTLRYLNGMDHQGIEQTMGLSNGALRGILGRALGKLRQSLKPVMAQGKEDA